MLLTYRKNCCIIQLVLYTFHYLDRLQQRTVLNPNLQLKMQMKNLRKTAYILPALQTIRLFAMPSFPALRAVSKLRWQF